MIIIILRTIEVIVIRIDIGITEVITRKVVRDPAIKKRERFLFIKISFLILIKSKGKENERKKSQVG